MKLITAILQSWLIILILYSGVNARELETYQGEITVPILENDSVYARNNAFYTLQNLLLTAAIKDLIGRDLAEEYHYEISKNKMLQPANFLVSAKVLKEQSENRAFSMELEGIIQVSTLADELRKMELVLLNDPWTPITVVVDSGVAIPAESLKTRLELFRIKTSEFRIVEIKGFDVADRSSIEFAKVLFTQAPRGKIICFIDPIPSEAPGLIKAIRTQIFRKSDFALISAFQWDLPVPMAGNDIDELQMGKYLKLFNISSIKKRLYNEGQESTLVLGVEGLVDPLIRNIFEDKILSADKRIKSFSLIQLSANKVEYELQLSYGPDELMEFLNKDNPYFYFIAEKAGPNYLTVESFYRFNDTAVELAEWEPDAGILEQISDALNEETLKFQLRDRSIPVNALKSEFIPRLVEKEPNNNSKSLNLLPPSTLVIGIISSRADEDIFQLAHPEDSSTIVVEWMKIGKTALSPQIRLYDQDFTFINNYNLIGNQSRLKFQYSFKQNPPQRLYIRITDRVGYIQGETGGFKTFRYLLRYHWQSNSQQLGSELPKANNVVIPIKRG